MGSPAEGAGIAQSSRATVALLALNAYWGGLSFMWSALHPILLPAMLAAMVPADRKNTYLGLLTFAGLIIAMVVQPISGAVSDRWKSRFGRRRPMMLIGTVLDVLFLSILAWAGGLGWLLVGYVGLQISSNVAQGPLQALLRDHVPAHQLGAASSIKVFLDLSGLVMASIVAGRLAYMGTGPTSPIFIAITVLLIGSAAVTIFSSGEARSGLGHSWNEPFQASQGVRPTGTAPGYRWLIAERFLFLLGVYGLQAFGQYFLQDALEVSDPQRQTANLLAVIGAGTVLFVLVGGRMADRVGAKRVLFAASGLAATGLLAMAWIAEIRGLYAAGALIGAGMGLFLTSNWTLANRMAPAAQAGGHLGLTNIATAGAAALARLEGPGVDWLNSVSPGAWLGYRGIFVFGGVCVALSVLLLRRTR